MEVFVQQLVNALSLGGTYALLALGLAMVFNILGLINFAYGELLTIAGYTLFFSLALGLPFGAGALFAVAAAILASMLMERLAFRPVRGASAGTMLITSFAVSIILRVLFQNLISPRPKAIPIPDALAGAVSLGGIVVGTIQLLSIAATVILLSGLLFFLKTTMMGRAMRAAAEDFPVTRLMGIRANAVVLAAFAISGLLGGVAGLLWVAQGGSVSPLMGFLPVLKAFIAAIIGGLGSLSGAVAGGFLLGGVEMLLQAFLPEGVLPFRDALALLLVIAVLIWRPEGLLVARAGTGR